MFNNSIFQILIGKLFPDYNCSVSFDDNDEVEDKNSRKKCPDIYEKDIDDDVLSFRGQILSSDVDLGEIKNLVIEDDSENVSAKNDQKSFNINPFASPILISEGVSQNISTTKCSKRRKRCSKSKDETQSGQNISKNMQSASKIVLNDEPLQNTSNDSSITPLMSLSPNYFDEVPSPNANSLSAFNNPTSTGNIQIFIDCNFCLLIDFIHKIALIL